MLQEFHEETPSQNAYEFSHGIEAVFVPKMRIGVFAKQQYENALQEMHFEGG